LPPWLLERQHTHRATNSTHESLSLWMACRRDAHRPNMPHVSSESLPPPSAMRESYDAGTCGSPAQGRALATPHPSSRYRAHGIVSMLRPAEQPACRLPLVQCHSLSRSGSPLSRVLAPHMRMHLPLSRAHAARARSATGCCLSVLTLFAPHMTCARAPHQPLQ